MQTGLSKSHCLPGVQTEVSSCLHFIFYEAWKCYLYTVSLFRYEILTPNAIPNGFMDGKQACERMVSHTPKPEYY